ncbi:MAG: hypothetical protein JSR46_03175 [Verrucomicrobia bacterium]|nr:hypothetical protein [Verrucomicrobiota bacterium]
MSYSSPTAPLGSPSFDHPVYTHNVHDLHKEKVERLINYVNRNVDRYVELEENLNKKMGTKMTFLSDFVADVKRMHAEGRLSSYIMEQESKKLLSHRDEYSNIFNGAWNDELNTYSPKVRATLQGGDPFRGGPLKDLTFADWNKCFDEVTHLTKIMDGHSIV